ncbi:MAG: 30S ribosomal protein S14 [Rickettsiales bacterium]|jgi:small subunit ribosomal protein S14|nr:30S ribosomal protein S14 [Rickettsiales bacterium]
MAKVSSIDKNKKRTAKAFSSIKKRSMLKDIIYSKDLPMEERFAAVQKLSKLPRNSSLVRVRRRCAVTGRPRGNYRFFGLCRNMLRELAASGKLPGVIKSSW